MRKIVLYASALLFSLSGYAQQALWSGGDIVSPQIKRQFCNLPYSGSQSFEGRN